MSDKNKEEAVRKRYGKDVTITTEYETNDKKEVVKSICKWVTKSGRTYSLTEELTDGLTSGVILIENGRERRYKNHLEAEVSLIDIISEE